MRVLVATDRPSLGAALALFLAEHDVEVVGVVAQAHDVCARVTAASVDVVIVDWHLAACDTADLVAGLKAGPGAVPVVVLSSSGDHASAHVSGAAAIATLGDTPDELLALLREVVPGSV